MRPVFIGSGPLTEQVVVDASIVVELLRGGDMAQRLASLLFDGGTVLHAPELLDIEVTQVVRRLERDGTITTDRGASAVRLLQELPIHRHGHAPLLGRLWTLRHRCSAYDAAYVALTEGVGATLWTLDARLAKSVEGLIATHVPAEPPLPAP